MTKGDRLLGRLAGREPTTWVYLADDALYGNLRARRQPSSQD
ncbi:MAG: hypothetical protein V3U20_02010 [Thermoplasmata archaeon]